MTPPIHKTHGCQSDLNLALLNHVAKHVVVSYRELFAHFGELQDSLVKAHARFSKKLEYLTYTEQLSCTSGRGRDRVFELGPQAGKPKASAAWVQRRESSRVGDEVPAASAAPEPMPSPCLSRLPANVLGSRSPVLRPGALDYQRVPSRGFAC